MRIKIKMRFQLKRFGKTTDIRAKRILRNSMGAMGGVVLRKCYRERAKQLVHQFLKDKHEQHYLFSKASRRYQQIVFIQRMVQAKLKVPKDVYLEGANLNKTLIAKGIQAFLVRLLVHNTKKEKAEIELFESQFEKMKDFRDNMKEDKEKLCHKTKELRGQEA